MSATLWQRVRIKRADRLIAGAVLANILLAWLVIVGLDTFQEFAKQIGNIGHNGYTLGAAVAYIALTVPRRVYDWFVFAALIGGLIGLGGLGASGELTALRASGMSKLRICLSAAALVLVLMAGVFLLGETVAPAGEQRAQNIQLSTRSGKLGNTRSGLWAKDGDTIINAKAALARVTQGRPSVELADVRVFGFNDAGELISFDWARTATQQGGQWIMYGVRSTTISPKGAHSTFAQQRSWKSGLDPQVLELSVVHPEYLSLADLQRNIDYLRSNRQNPGTYANAYWERALYPLNTLVLTLCALPFAFGALRSGGLGRRLFIGLLLAIGWYFLQKAVIGLGTVFGVPALAANLAPALLLICAAVWYFRRA
ncbi:MAG TPA: LPS export ABC transporter permease LptG [Rhodanobacteraceae bacterium]|nr:LPS export ABC transporter permease LptG [Rhodanobacteraceae bacterium]